jgi:hypothetical protein
LAAIIVHPASTGVLRLGFAFGPSRRSSIPPVIRPLLTAFLVRDSRDRRGTRELRVTYIAPALIAHACRSAWPELRDDIVRRRSAAMVYREPSSMNRPGGGAPTGNISSGLAASVIVRES